MSQQTNRDSGNYIIQDINYTEVEGSIAPPPSHLTSEFKTIEQWLQHICANDEPQKIINQYQVSLFESPDDYTLALFGVNKYDESKNSSIKRIDFEPSNMYFKLPKSYFKNLNKKQLLEKLTAQLKDFSKTEKFKKSFFTKANKIIFETNGETVWSK
ncbi:MAG: hypothetical protein ACMG51_02055 [Ginsengibacter sp.]